MQALGQHNSNIQVKLTSKQGTHIMDLPLLLTGSSTAMGPKPVNVGGTDKVPADFEKPRKYRDDEQVRAAIHFLKD